MKKNQPVSVSLRPWLRENLGKHCLAPLTSADSKALDAAIHIIELYSIDRDDRLIVRAFATVVRRMQESTRYLAYHATAHSLDWSDRSHVWFLAGFSECPTSRCQHEPADRSPV